MTDRTTTTHEGLEARLKGIEKCSLLLVFRLEICSKGQVNSVGGGGGLGA